MGLVQSSRSQTRPEPCLFGILDLVKLMFSIGHNTIKCRLSRQDPTEPNLDFVAQLQEAMASPALTAHTEAIQYWKKSLLSWTFCLPEKQLGSN